MNCFLHDDSNENDLLRIDGFFGDGNWKNHNATLHEHNAIVLISGGVGITPFMSMISFFINTLSNREEKNTTEKK